jgi:hypothetical protein
MTEQEDAFLKSGDGGDAVGWLHERAEDLDFCVEKLSFAVGLSSLACHAILFQRRKLLKEAKDKGFESCNCSLMSASRRHDNVVTARCRWAAASPRLLSRSELAKQQVIDWMPLLCVSDKSN